MCKYCFNEFVRHQGLCSESLQRPKEDKKKHRAFNNAKVTLSDFLLQKNISAKNLKTIRSFCESEDDELRELASLLLAIGTRFPRKKKRWRKIRQQTPEHYQQLRQNLLFGWLEEKGEFDDHNQEDLCSEIEGAGFDRPLDNVPF